MITITEVQFQQLQDRLGVFLEQNGMDAWGNEVYRRDELKELFKQFVAAFCLTEKKVLHDSTICYTRFAVEGHNNSKTNFYHLKAELGVHRVSNHCPSKGLHASFVIEKVYLTDRKKWSSKRVKAGHTMMYYRNEES